MASRGVPDDRDDAGVDVEELDEFDLLLIEYKAVGLSDEATALKLGRRPKTVQRHKKRPAVAAAIAERKAERVTQVSAMLGEAAPEAVTTLRECLHAARDSDRVRAVVSALCAATLRGTEDGLRDDNVKVVAVGCHYSVAA
jgi:hypothetical protein